jgi:hypothetical protein
MSYTYKYSNGYARIACAAIKYNGKIYSLPRPNRHPDIVRSIGGVAGPSQDGFLDANGNWLTRGGAYIRAQRTGQIKRKDEFVYVAGLLYTEDLW